MDVGEICNRNVVIIGKYESIYTAARLMRDHHVHDVIVVESNSGINIPVGMLTDREIVIGIVADELDLGATLIGEVMKNHLLMANESDDVIATLKRMRHKGIRRIPVANQMKGLVGILSIDNILDSLVEQLNDIDQIITREQNRDETLGLRPAG